MIQRGRDLIAAFDKITIRMKPASLVPGVETEIAKLQARGFAFTKAA